MQEIQRTGFHLTGAHVFAALFLLAAGLAAALIGAFPLESSILTIFLFAAAHNAFEFRYFLARMPVRWGKSRVYYSVGIGGVLILTAVYLAIYFESRNWLWSVDSWQIMVSCWNTALVCWLALLFYLRGRQKPQADWSWAFPAAFFAAALAWTFPAYWSLALVYLHPFVALWFLERQIRRTRRAWLRAYRVCLSAIPIFLLILYFGFSGAPDLSNETGLFRRITEHAGRSLLPGVSSHFLVAAHVFLESLHYAVWILLIPLVDRRAIPWKLKEIPLGSHKDGFPKIVLAAVAVSFLLVGALSFGFSLDYEATRDVYFAFAIAHVLAEFPFLVKML